MKKSRAMLHRTDNIVHTLKQFWQGKMNNFRNNFALKYRVKAISNHVCHAGKLLTIAFLFCWRLFGATGKNKALSIEVF